jgi:hypothetical protein
MAYHISTPTTFDNTTIGDLITFNASGPIANTGAQISSFVCSLSGDMLYRSATANVLERLAIGTTGQVLQVVGGLPSWQTATGPMGTNSFAVSASADGTAVPTGVTFQTLTSTQVTWDNATSGNHDAGAMFNTTTGIFTVPATGTYLISAGVRFAGNNTGTGSIAGKIGIRQARVFNTTVASTNPVYLFNDAQANASNTNSTSVILGPVAVTLTATNTFALQVRHDAAVALAMADDVDNATTAFRAVYFHVTRLF